MRRILIIDDFHDNIELYRLILESSTALLGDVQVVEALDGEMALRHLSMYGPFDLVITDMSMPRMGGDKLLEVIRSGGVEAETTGTSRDVPVGLITSYASQREVDSFSAMGFS